MRNLVVRVVKTARGEAGGEALPHPSHTAHA